MELEELRVLITAQTSGLRRELNNVRTQLSGLNTSANKSTAGVGAAFSQLKTFIIALGIGKVIKDSITEGMNAVESENLFSVSLGNMADEAKAWSQDLQDSLGLNGYDVRKNLGILYTMTTSMGLTRDAAYGLSEDMTKLAYDMSSFYNISDEESFTKIRAGLTGETEPLKALGIMVDEATVKQYAYSLGIAKSGDELTNQQKVMARYQAILAQTGNAQGDLARTINSPANQLRLLKTNLQLLETELGRAFLPVLQVVIPILTTLVKTLTQTMTVLSQFTQSLFGSAVGSMATTITDSNISAYNGTSAQSDYADSIGATGDAAKQTAKELKGLMGFDEINTLGKDKNTDPVSPININKPVLGNTSAEVGNAMSALQPYIDKVMELKNLFLEGFTIGLGNSNFDGIKESLGGIKDSLLNIFGDSGVQEAANKFVNSFVTDVGKELGALTSIGITIADNVLGGIDIYLGDNKERIKKWLIEMFDISGSTNDIRANFMVAIADIFSVFSSDTAKQITADFIAMFANSFMGFSELFAKVGRDILDCITRPIIDNKDAIKNAIEQTMEPIQTVTGKTSEFITGMWDKINAVYDEKVKPAFDNIASGLSNLFGKIVELYSTYLAPVLDEWAGKFTTLVDEHIKPFADKFITLIGSICEYIGMFWHDYLEPAFDFIISVLVPILTPLLQFIGDTVMNVIGMICDYVGGMITTFQGIIDFFFGVFTGDWDRVWKGLQEIVQGPADAINGIMNGLKQFFYDWIEYVKGMFAGWGNALGATWSYVCDKVSQMWSNLQSIFNGMLSYIGDSFASAWSNAWNGIVSVFNNVWSGIQNAAKGPLNYVIDMINKAISGFNSFASVDLPGVGNIGVSIPTIPRLARGGILDQPTLAMVGEAGKEAVMPLENNTGWITDLADKVASRMPQGSNGKQSLTLPIYIGGDHLTDVVIDNINKITVGSGVCPIVI